MDKPLSCPGPDRLQQILAASEGVPDDGELNRHLAGCSRCQNVLERFVGGDGIWPERIRQAQWGRDASDQVLERAIAELKAVGPSDVETEPKIALDFLRPPPRTGCLGLLDHYEVMEIVGRGGMGVVLKAFDTSLRRVVAIKVLARHLADNATARKRFAREAQAAAAVSHDHIVTIHAVEATKNPPYIVMQFIEGKSLQQRIDQSGALETKEILRIGMQTAAGLAAAHAQGLVHRDIKPANILLENGVERVKITDFGLARAVDDASVTESGVVAGTPQYMAPEQATGEAVDHRADLFSLGSVLYAMCTGRPPFRASTTMGLLKRVCDETPRPIRELNPESPDWLGQIIERLHAKRPEDRFQSADEVSESLARYLAELQNSRSIGSRTPGADDSGFSNTAAPPARQATDAERGTRLSRGEPRHEVARAGYSGRRRLGYVALVIAAMACIAVTEATGVTQFAQSVIRIARGDGTLVIEVDDPDVKVTLDGKEVVIMGAGPNEIRLGAGSHLLLATRDGVPKSYPITIRRGGREIVRVHFESPSPAVTATPRTEQAVPGTDEPIVKLRSPPHDDRIAQLSNRVSISIESRPLLEVLQEFEKDHKIEFVLDTGALHDQGVAADTPVSVKRSEVPLREALEGLLAPLDMTWVFRHETVLITSEMAAYEVYLDTKVYAVAPVADAQKVVENITDTVAPDTWSIVGGPGTIEPFGGAIVIRNSRDIHERIASSYHEHLKLIPSLVAAATQLPGRLGAALAARGDISADGMPLGEFFKQLETKHEINIDLDLTTLAEQGGITPEVPLSIQVNNITLESVLGLLRIELGIGWITQGETLVITTALRADEEMIRLSYNVQPLIGLSKLEPPAALERLIEVLEQTTGYESWSVAGGPGVAREGINSLTLDILQSRKIHAEIDAILNALGQER